MRSKVLIGVGAIVVLAITVPALALKSAPRRAPHKGVSVSPASGGPDATFTVRFTAPARTGSVGQSIHSDELTVMRNPGGRTAGQTPTGCASSGSLSLPPSRAGAAVSVKLNARRFGARWCAGHFRGEVTELARPRCTTGELCPQYVAVLARVGNFSFTVRSRG